MDCVIFVAAVKHSGMLKQSLSHKSSIIYPLLFILFFRLFLDPCRQRTDFRKRSPKTFNIYYLYKGDAQ